jgi:hypothetical protein
MFRTFEMLDPNCLVVKFRAGRDNADYVDNGESVREIEGGEMEGYRIPKSWLTKRIEPGGDDWSWAVGQLGAELRPDDELWHFDESAPPGVNAGAMGIALVRDGEPIRTAITAVH